MKPMSSGQIWFLTMMETGRDYIFIQSQAVTVAEYFNGLRRCTRNPKNTWTPWAELEAALWFANKQYQQHQGD